MITAKISVTLHHGYLDYEQPPTNVTTWTTMMPRRVVNGAKNQPSTSYQSLKMETPSCRLLLATQLAGVVRDGQGLPGVRLRGFTSLVLCPVLGFI